MTDEISRRCMTGDDESLIQEIHEKNHEAFTILVNRHSHRFYKIAYRFVFDKSEAEDIVQEAFLKIWKNIEIWDQSKQTKFTTWFYKIVINLCIDRNKKKKPLSLPEDIQLTDKKAGQESLIEQQQKQALLESFIRELPERQQTALNLCFYEGVSNKEAAEIMGINVKALQSLIMRAKTTLRGKIQQ